MKTNTAKFFAGILAAAGCLVLTAPARAFWTDGGQGGAAEQLGIPADGKDKIEIPVPKEAARTGGQAAGAPFQPVEWSPIEGGQFLMGTDAGGDESCFADARPVHEVTIKDFEMSRTAVTVEQYAECVSAGQCRPPLSTGGFCNWGRPDRQRHPINGISWDRAVDYAKFKGARLPSEAEWEYAATSGGKKRDFPWGDENPTCENGRAVLNGGDHVYGCDGEGTMPVCSKPAGNTQIDALLPDQQLCDMVGNVKQWVQDTYQDSYRGAPSDGSAFEAPVRPYTFRTGVLRGSSFLSNDFKRFAKNIKVVVRESEDDSPLGCGYRGGNIGFRLAR